MIEELLVKIDTNLSKMRIPYMIIGGQAVLIYGEPRFTRDIDITLGIDVFELPKLLNTVELMKLKILVTEIEEFVKQTYVLPTIDNNTGIRIDFIFSFTEYEKCALKRVNRIIIGNNSVNFASIEDLIIHKIFSGRERDYEDIRSVILKNPPLDFLYINKWLKLFDESFPEKEFLDKFNEILKDTEFK